MPHIRALPWANRQELAQLYAWIWDDPEDRESTERAVARLSTYLQSPSQPQFIPILHTLLTALLLPHPPPTPAAHLATRLTLGAALTRFVNSLVDPLQQRTYARPIGLIARELGLPDGLVALRHAVTHEDLPGLEVLRLGAGRALEWLRVEVVGPAVWPGDVVPELSEAWDGQEEFMVAIGKYKKLIKAYYRQRTSARGAEAVTNSGGWEGARELRMVMRQIEDVVGAALESKADDARERVARSVVRVLLARQGGMIPSLRKRPRYDPERPDLLPAPTTAILRIWTPLLTLLKDKFSPTDEEDEDEDTPSWAEWFTTECGALLRDVLDERESTTSVTNGKGKAKSVEGAVHEEEDYWIVPSDEDEAPSPASRKPDTEETTTYLASLAGWLFYGLTCASTAPPSEVNAKKRKRRAGDEETGMEAVFTMDEAARMRLVRVLVGQVVGDGGVRVVRDAVEVYEGRGREHTLGPRSFHVLAALMRVDQTCREVAYQLAAGGAEDAEDVSGDEVAVLEERLALFRKMMAARSQVATVGEGEQESRMEVSGWVKLGAQSGWKECPIGYWRG